MSSAHIVKSITNVFYIRPPLATPDFANQRFKKPISHFERSLYQSRTDTSSSSSSSLSGEPSTILCGERRKEHPPLSLSLSLSGNEKDFLPHAQPRTPPQKGKFLQHVTIWRLLFVLVRVDIASSHMLPAYHTYRFDGFQIKLLCTIQDSTVTVHN